MGSSAMTSDGLPATAMAIMTRWRSPPDSSWGYARRRRAGSGTPTASSSRMASVELPAASATCRPIRMVGLSEVMGSWKTAPRCSLRTRRDPSAPAATMSVPHTTACPGHAGGRPGRQQSEQGEPEHALARSRLADQSQDLAGPDVEGDPPEGMDRPAPPLERHVEVLDA